jgi:DNA polymerase-2
LWLLEENGQRSRLSQAFPVTFYVAGPAPRLRALWGYLRAQPVEVSLARAERRDLFTPQPLAVLAIQVARPGDQPSLFGQISRDFPDLTYYDADLPLPLRHAAVHGTFPLARCRVITDSEGRVQALSVPDSPWELDPDLPPLRVLILRPDVDPSHAAPQFLWVRSAQGACRLSLAHPRPLLLNLRALLNRHDPDVLLTTWGDTWLLPYLLEQAQGWGISLPLNRDPAMEVARRAERTYFSYGQVIYRGQQAHLFGRWHIDAWNAMLFHEYGLDGVLELGRVTALPVQTVARVSPGSGISAMQMLTALRQGVLVPWRKQQAEFFKSARQLIQVDQGGLVYQPLVGLHADVAEVDFVSMYPSIMARFNISPETVGTRSPTAEPVTEIGLCVDRTAPGLVPQTLSPLLGKRLAYKTRLAELPAWDPRRQTYKARATAHKWLLVTCFGYLGYKNARFGRIEAHEAVTAYGREALLRAKEAAEDLGFTVLHMYVDGLWVQRQGARQVADFQPLLDEIATRTGLPIAMEGIYRWVAFLPSRLDSRLPVPNRYFGVFQDGTLKCRGIEARRQDTPPWIAGLQMKILERLAQAPEAGALPASLSVIVRLLREALADLRAGRVPLSELLVTQKLSRELQEYRSPSPAARAAAQLALNGSFLKPGQRVRFLYTRGASRVKAWDLPQAPDPRSLDVAYYQELLLRAAATVVQPLGVDDHTLRGWVIANASTLRLGRSVPESNECCFAMPDALRGLYPVMPIHHRALTFSSE